MKKKWRERGREGGEEGRRARGEHDGEIGELRERRPNEKEEIC